MMALIFMTFLGAVPIEKWEVLDVESRSMVVHVMAKKYFEHNDMCAEAEIKMHSNGKVIKFYGKCVKPYA